MLWTSDDGTRMTHGPLAARACAPALEVLARSAEYGRPSRLHGVAGLRAARPLFPIDPVVRGSGHPVRGAPGPSLGTAPRPSIG